MPKAIVIDPAEARRAREVTFAPIPVNDYRRPFAEERAGLGDSALIELLRWMVLIREVETALDAVKRDGRYGDVEYVHQGPAHLSIGQEAAAVGEAFLLGADDHIFGSHRSHGEILAKGLSVIARAEEGWLDEVMHAYLGGDILRVVERGPDAPDIRSRGTQFLLYGLLAEIFGRRTGFNRGLGGSMHAFFVPFGIYPNNAIVGASCGIAAGAALFKKALRQPGLTIANVGDGATGCGHVWEALNFASMRQFERLWEDGYQGGLPVIFVFVDNFYAMGGQTIGETMGYDVLSRIGAAVNERNLHAETVDGNDPLAVLDAIRRKREVVERGEGPVLLDVLCYRQSGHSTSDASAYRSSEEIEAWRAVDPVVTFGDRLEAAGVIEAGARAGLAEQAREQVLEALRLATDPLLSPPPEPSEIGRLTFSHTLRDLSPQQVGLLLPLDRSSRLQAIAKLSRAGGEAGTKAVTIRDALFEAIVHHAAHDERLIIYGEEHRDWEGAFGVYRGLTELLPYRRFFNAPISEAAIVATAVGYALEGGRALIELMYADFIGRAGDELLNQLAKWQAMSGGTVRMPVVVRVSVGSRYGAQHSQEWSSLLAHVPGLKVVYPVTPYDAKGLMASALSGDDPVLFFESQQLYGTVELFHEGGVPRDYYHLPLGVPDLKRAGGDLTILSVGATLYRALDAAKRLANDHGVETDVIDARSLVPFDYEPLLDSLARTHRLLVTSDASERGSFAATLAAEAQRLAFDQLDAPVAVVGAPNWITPPAELEATYFPQPERMLAAVHHELLPLPGYVPSSDPPDRVAAARRGL